MDLFKHLINLYYMFFCNSIKFIFLITFLFSCINNTSPIKFNKEKWRSGTQIQRGNMATDLVESNVLIGKKQIRSN